MTTICHLIIISSPVLRPVLVLKIVLIWTGVIQSVIYHKTSIPTKMRELVIRFLPLYLLLPILPGVISLDEELKDNIVHMLGGVGAVFREGNCADGIMH